jgi:hypothetical protein
MQRHRDVDEVRRTLVRRVRAGSASLLRCGCGFLGRHCDDVSWWCWCVKGGDSDDALILAMTRCGCEKEAEEVRVNIERAQERGGAAFK